MLLLPKLIVVVGTNLIYISIIYITGLLDDQDTTPGFFKGSKALDVEPNHNSLPNGKNGKIKNSKVKNGRLLPLQEDYEEEEF